MNPPSGDKATWHSLAVADVLRELSSSVNGLSEKTASERLAPFGPNELQAGQKVSAWQVLISQFKNILLLILIIATGLSIAAGHGTEAVVIAVIVYFAVALGFYQEYRAERAMEALQQMAAPLATAIRDGEETQLPARELVPGDVILLNAGDKIPADCRLMEVRNLQADEAPLTGESVPVEKQTEPLADGNLAAGDRTNIAFAGTAITYGRGRGGRDRHRNEQRIRQDRPDAPGHRTVSHAAAREPRPSWPDAGHRCAGHRRCRRGSRSVAARKNPADSH
jgi:Ca2+-transporting ATPase